MLTKKTFALTVPLSKLTRKARVQKSCKFGKQPVCWDKSCWKDYNNPHDRRRFGVSSPLYAHRRAGARFKSSSGFFFLVFTFLATISSVSRLTVQRQFVNISRNRMLPLPYLRGATVPIFGTVTFTPTKNDIGWSASLIN